MSTDTEDQHLLSPKEGQVPIAIVPSCPAYVEEKERIFTFWEKCEFHSFPPFMPRKEGSELFGEIRGRIHFLQFIKFITKTP